MNKTVYNGYSGVDIIQVFADGTRRPVRGVSYSVMREPYPIYTVEDERAKIPPSIKIAGHMLFHKEQQIDVCFDLLLVATEGNRTKTMKLEYVNLIEQAPDDKLFYTFMCEHVTPWKETTNDQEGKNDTEML